MQMIGLSSGQAYNVIPVHAILPTTTSLLPRSSVRTISILRDHKLIEDLHSISSSYTNTRDIYAKCPHPRCIAHTRCASRARRQRRRFKTHLRHLRRRSQAVSSGKLALVSPSSVPHQAMIFQPFEICSLSARYDLVCVRCYCSRHASIRELAWLGIIAFGAVIFAQGQLFSALLLIVFK